MAIGSRLDSKAETTTLVLKINSLNTLNTTSEHIIAPWKHHFLSGGSYLYKGVASLGHGVLVVHRQREATVSRACKEEIDRLTNELQHVNAAATDCYTKATQFQIEALESLDHETKILASQNASLASQNEALASKLDHLSHQFVTDKQEFSEQSQKFAVSTAAQIQRLEREVARIAGDVSRLDVIREHEETIAGLKDELERVKMINTSEKNIFDERTNQLQKNVTTCEIGKERLTQEVLIIISRLQRYWVVRVDYLIWWGGWHSSHIGRDKDGIQYVYFYFFTDRLTYLYTRKS